MNNVGALNALDFKAYDWNKLVIWQPGGTTTVLGSCKNWKRTANETRLKEKDNSPLPVPVVDLKTEVDVEVTFDLDEMNPSNLALIVGHAPDANGRYFPSNYDGTVCGLYAYGQNLQNPAQWVCYAIPKGRLRGQLQHGEGAGPQIRKWNVTMGALSDTDGSYQAPQDVYGNPALDFFSPIAAATEYGYSA